MFLEHVTVDTSFCSFLITKILCMIILLTYLLRVLRNLMLVLASELCFSDFFLSLHLVHLSFRVIFSHLTSSIVICCLLLFFCLYRNYPTASVLACNFKDVFLYMNLPNDL